MAKQSSAATVPAEKKRTELLKEMAPETQKVAKDFEGKISAAAQGLVLIRYDMGARLRTVIEQEAKYGVNAVEQLAGYLNFPGGATGLYTLRNFAIAFDRDFVKEQASLTMSNGRPLETGHFLAIMKVKSKKAQNKLFDRVRQECLSTNSLEEEIRAEYDTKNKRSGGRKPKTPTTPMAGLQKAFSQSQQLTNYLDVCEDAVFSKIDEMTPADVSPKLLERIDVTLKQLQQADEAVESGVKHLQKSRTRVLKILDEQKKNGAPKKKTAKKGTKKKSAASSTKKKSSTKKTPTKKASTKKKGTKKKGTKKKSARRRPAAV